MEDVKYQIVKLMDVIIKCNESTMSSNTKKTQSNSMDVILKDKNKQEFNFDIYHNIKEKLNKLQSQNMDYSIGNMSQVSSSSQANSNNHNKKESNHSTSTDNN